MKTSILFTAATLLFSFTALAYEYAPHDDKQKEGCWIHYDRISCEGQEKISYKKCPGGEKKCWKRKGKKGTSDEDCLKKGVESCSNSRYEITRWKVIKVWNDGKKLVDDADTTFCEKSENWAKNFPHYAKNKTGNSCK